MRRSLPHSSITPPIARHCSRASRCRNHARHRRPTPSDPRGPMDILIPLAAALAAAGVAILVMRTNAARQLAEARADMAARLAAAERDNAWLREEVHRHEASARAGQELLEKADARLRETLPSLAAEALTDNRASFFDLARASFEGYHQPIAEALKKVDARLGDAERDRVSAYSRLAEQVTALGAATGTLSRALRTPSVRGRWGEMQLRRVVEVAGMLPRCDFDEQPSLYTENGRQRPDLIVHLPGGKQIVVDAKAPLEAFLD